MSPRVLEQRNCRTAPTADSPLLIVLRGEVGHTKNVKTINLIIILSPHPCPCQNFLEQDTQIVSLNETDSTAVASAVGDGMAMDAEPPQGASSSKVRSSRVDKGDVRTGDHAAAAAAAAEDSVEPFSIQEVFDLAPSACCTSGADDGLKLPKKVRLAEQYTDGYIVAESFSRSLSQFILVLLVRVLPLFLRPSGVIPAGAPI